MVSHSALVCARSDVARNFLARGKGIHLDSVKRLVVVLASGSHTEPGPALLAFRYAATAAAMDIEVEIHAVGASVGLLRRDTLPEASVLAAPTVNPAMSSRDFLSQIREMKSMDIEIYVCSAALAEANLSLSDLIPEVTGVRGAAALLVAGMAPDARLLTF